MSNAMIYIGIVVGVIAMGNAIAYGTINQQANMSDELVQEIGMCYPTYSRK